MSMRPVQCLRHLRSRAPAGSSPGGSVTL
jgi:hypothetical protein